MGVKTRGWQRSHASFFSGENGLPKSYDFFSCHSTPAESGRVIYLGYLSLFSPVKRELYVAVGTTRVPHGKPANSLDNERL